MTTASPSVASLLLVWDAHKASLTHPSPATAAGLVSQHFDEQASVVYVPTAAGGVGVADIEGFFRKVVAQAGCVVDDKVINRVIGEYSIAEESILTIVHEDMLDWLLPDVKPTKRRVVIPMSTFVTFSPDAKITAKRVYWDQGSVMRQIGLLPPSVFCKANGSETTLPVLGPKIVDRLTDVQAPSNLILREHWEESPVAGIATKANGDKAPGREPVHGIIPQGDDEEEIRLAQAKRLHRTSVSSIVPQAEEPTPVLRHHRSMIIPRQTSNIFNQDPVEQVRPSTRIHHQPGGKSSNIFGDEPVPLRTLVPADPRRFESHINFGRDAAVAAEEPFERQDTSAHFRRDPNWSSLDQARGDPVHTGKKVFGQMNNQSHFSFGNDDKAVPLASGGRKHSDRAHADNDIFGGPDNSANRPRSGKRDPNARSTEAFARPSSRVLRPPGGGQSFAF
ncbi:hypothetical protein SpCBS45565_g07428 [Spizellomyces sp. 'palustris']|nr:hypothetical protein SpCBS45565_g07428 [Spizellomyces sp. 'palustris']